MTCQLLVPLARVSGKLKLVLSDQVFISYVEEEEPLAARRANLVDYGFVCRCERCRSESESESEDLAGQRRGAGIPSPDA